MAEPTRSLETRTPTRVLLTAGVDWLSVSCCNESGNEYLWKAMNDLLTTEAPQADDRKHWHIRAFSGTQTESYALATDGETVIAQLRGGQAEVEWRTLLVFVDNVSRMDVQVTANAMERHTGVAQKVYRCARTGPNRGGRPPSCSLVVNSEGGETAYIGRRTSDYFLRVYDKGVQSESAPPGSVWRWEVEVKGLPAWHLAKTAFREAWKPAHFASYVHRQFQLRGAEPDWKADLEVSVAPVIKEHEDDRRSLEWLRQAVPHTMARLVRHGFGAEVAQIVDAVPGLRATLESDGEPDAERA